MSLTYLKKRRFFIKFCKRAHKEILFVSPIPTVAFCENRRRKNLSFQDAFRYIPTYILT